MNDVAGDRYHHNRIRPVRSGDDSSATALRADSGHGGSLQIIPIAGSPNKVTYAVPPEIRMREASSERQSLVSRGNDDDRLCQTTGDG